MSLTPTETQIETFVSAAIIKSKPSWIITTERKATALLRTVLEKYPTLTRWDRIVSSDALKYFPEENLREGTVLVVEDSICQGQGVTEILKILEEKDVPRERIKIAAFSVHKDSQINVDFHWFGQLGRSQYENIRESMLSYFQRKGSLLLDTEHIEVIVQLQCGRLEFFDALCSAGKGVEYLASSGRKNLTIHNPIILNENEFIEKLPKGTSIKNVVRKIRVVERDNNQYALIPICYPAIPVNLTRDSLSSLSECLANLASENPRTNFHLVGIFSAIYLFKTAFACLRDLVNKGKLKIRIPQPIHSFGSVSHLKPLFPPLEVEKLHSIVENIVEEGRHWSKQGQLGRFGRIEAGPGTRYAADIDQLHWLILKKVRYLSEGFPTGPNGATPKELLDIVRFMCDNKKELPIREALLSAAMDKAIDDAHLVTGVDEVLYDDGIMRMVRIFRLDGEVILSKVRKLMLLWRLPSPPDLFQSDEIES